jgi:hypothetical protein
MPRRNPRLSPMARQLNGPSSPDVTSFGKILNPPRAGVGQVVRAPEMKPIGNVPFRLEAGVSSRIVADNPYRKYLLIQNLDTVEQMIVNFGQDADAISGITLQPLGVAFFDIFVPQASVFCFSAGNISGFLQQGTSTTVVDAGERIQSGTAV